MQSEELLELAQQSLEDNKARDIKVIDMRGLSSMTDHLLIASGTSDRHVRSLSRNLIDDVREAGQKPIGVEGLETAEWILIDLNDVIVHVMQPRIRDYYKLEDLWEVGSRPNLRRAGN